MPRYSRHAQYPLYKQGRNTRRMGAFDKDKEYGLRLDQEISLGSHFVLWDARLPGRSIATKIGEAEVCEMDVSHLEDPSNKITVNTVAAAIVDKFRDGVDADEVPCVCKLLKVPSRFGNDALVINYIKPFDGS